MRKRHKKIKQIVLEKIYGVPFKKTLVPFCVFCAFLWLEKVLVGTPKRLWFFFVSFVHFCG